jgi:hypothetical protein
LPAPARTVVQSQQCGRGIAVERCDLLRPGSARGRSLMVFIGRRKGVGTMRFLS